jgi:hypothetical protein
MAKARKKRQVGRPAKPKAERKRNNLTIRVRDALREDLGKSAAANQRSVSEETEMRLLHSFQVNDFVRQALSLAYGPRTAALALILAYVIHETGTHAGFLSTLTPDGARDWRAIPFAFDQAVKAVDIVMKAFRPSGEIVPPQLGADSLNATYLRLGELMAAGALEAVKNPQRGGGIGDWAQPIRELLGDAASSLHVDDSAVIVSAFSPGPASPVSGLALLTKGKDKGGQKP